MINNHFVCEGNIGRDPEMKTTKNGGDFVSTSIGVYRTKEHTDWFNLKAFGTAAKQLNEVKKGDKVQVAGSVNVSEYEDKNGVKKKNVDVMVNYCRILPKIMGNVGTVTEKPASCGASDNLPFEPPF